MLCALTDYQTPSIPNTNIKKGENKMKKVNCVLFGMSIGFLLLAGSVWAVDYSTKTTEELNTLRGTMRYAPFEDRNAFVTEWQKRLHLMNPEERQKYSGRPQNAPADGKGNRYNEPAGYGYGRGRRR